MTARRILRVVESSAILVAGSVSGADSANRMCLCVTSQVKSAASGGCNVTAAAKTGNVGSADGSEWLSGTDWRMPIRRAGTRA